MIIIRILDRRRLSCSPICNFIQMW